jgi:putative Mg2+ transporter-C (MgtC) family protein
VDGEALLRLLVAVGLGAAVGVEREVAGHPAGLRTHVTVALGAALFGVISTLGFGDYSERPGTRAEVARAVTQVAVGVGFLGAGVIVQQGRRVRGLTTAASIWVVAAIGLAAGVGSLQPAAMTTALLLLTLLVLRFPAKWLHGRFGGDGQERPGRAVPPDEEEDPHLD